MIDQQHGAELPTAQREARSKKPTRFFAEEEVDDIVWNILEGKSLDFSEDDGDLVHPPCAAKSQITQPKQSRPSHDDLESAIRHLHEQSQPANTLDSLDQKLNEILTKHEEREIKNAILVQIEGKRRGAKDSPLSFLMNEDNKSTTGVSVNVTVDRSALGITPIMRTPTFAEVSPALKACDSDETPQTAATSKPSASSKRSKPSVRWNDNLTQEFESPKDVGKLDGGLEPADYDSLDKSMSDILHKHAIIMTKESVASPRSEATVKQIGPACGENSLRKLPTYSTDEDEPTSAVTVKSVTPRMRAVEKAGRSVKSREAARSFSEALPDLEFCDSALSSNSESAGRRSLPKASTNSKLPQGSKASVTRQNKPEDADTARTVVVISEYPERPVKARERPPRPSKQCISPQMSALSKSTAGSKQDSASKMFDFLVVEEAERLTGSQANADCSSMKCTTKQAVDNIETPKSSPEGTNSITSSKSSGRAGDSLSLLTAFSATESTTKELETVRYPPHRITRSGIAKAAFEDPLFTKRKSARDTSVGSVRKSPSTKTEKVAEVAGKKKESPVVEASSGGFKLENNPIMKKETQGEAVTTSNNAVLVDSESKSAASSNSLLSSSEASVSSFWSKSISSGSPSVGSKRSSRRGSPVSVKSDQAAVASPNTKPSTLHKEASVTTWSQSALATTANSKPPISPSGASVAPRAQSAMVARNAPAGTKPPPSPGGANTVQKSVSESTSSASVNSLWSKSISSDNASAGFKRSSQRCARVAAKSISDQAAIASPNTKPPTLHNDASGNTESQSTLVTAPNTKPPTPPSGAGVAPKIQSTLAASSETKPPTPPRGANTVPKSKSESSSSVSLNSFWSKSISSGIASVGSRSSSCRGSPVAAKSKYDEAAIASPNTKPPTSRKYSPSALAARAAAPNTKLPISPSGAKSQSVMAASVACSEAKPPTSPSGMSKSTSESTSSASANSFWSKSISSDSASAGSMRSSRRCSRVASKSKSDQAAIASPNTKPPTLLKNASGTTESQPELAADLNHKPSISLSGAGSVTPVTQSVPGATAAFSETKPPTSASGANTMPKKGSESSSGASVNSFWCKSISSGTASVGSKRSLRRGSRVACKSKSGQAAIASPDIKPPALPEGAAVTTKSQPELAVALNTKSPISPSGAGGVAPETQSVSGATNASPKSKPPTSPREASVSSNSKSSGGASALSRWKELVQNQEMPSFMNQACITAVKPAVCVVDPEETKVVGIVAVTDPIADNTIDVTGVARAIEPKSPKGEKRRNSLPHFISLSKSPSEASVSGIFTAKSRSSMASSVASFWAKPKPIPPSNAPESNSEVAAVYEATKSKNVAPVERTSVAAAVKSDMAACAPFSKAKSKDSFVSKSGDSRFTGCMPAWEAEEQEVQSFTSVEDQILSVVKVKSGSPIMILPEKPLTSNCATTEGSTGSSRPPDKRKSGRFPRFFSIRKNTKSVSTAEEDAVSPEDGDMKDETEVEELLRDVPPVASEDISGVTYSVRGAESTRGHWCCTIDELFGLRGTETAKGNLGIPAAPSGVVSVVLSPSEAFRSFFESLSADQVAESQPDNAELVPLERSLSLLGSRNHVDSLIVSTNHVVSEAEGTAAKEFVEPEAANGAKKSPIKILKRLFRNSKRVQCSKESYNAEEDPVAYTTREPTPETEIIAPSQVSDIPEEKQVEAVATSPHKKKPKTRRSLFGKLPAAKKATKQQALDPNICIEYGSYEQVEMLSSSTKRQPQATIPWKREFFN